MIDLKMLYIFFLGTFLSVLRYVEEQTYKKRVYGYEFGWRRKDLNGVNAVIRLYWKKPIVKVD